MDTPGDYRELGFSGTEGAGVAGNGSLVISRVSRDHAGFYLCQASNGIGPGLSKLIRLTVHGKIFTHCYECGSVIRPANLTPKFFSWPPNFSTDPCTGERLSGEEGKGRRYNLFIVRNSERIALNLVTMRFDESCAPSICVYSVIFSLLYIYLYYGIRIEGNVITRALTRSNWKKGRIRGKFRFHRFDRDLIRFRSLIKKYTICENTIRFFLAFP